MSDTVLFVEKIRIFLREYEVEFSCSDGNGEEFRAVAEVNMEISTENAVWDAIGLILIAIRAKVLIAFPPSVFNKLYIYPPPAWRWRLYDGQAEWGPSRWLISKSGFNRRLCMGFMVKGEK